MKGKSFIFRLIVSSLLLLLVLMQRPKQEGLGAAFGAAMTDQAFGARTTDVLKKGTIFFGSLFMLFCFILSVLMLRAHNNEVRSNINAAAIKKLEDEKAAAKKAADAEAAKKAAEAEAAKKAAEEAAAKKAAEAEAAAAPVDQATEAPAEQATEEAAATQPAEAPAA